VLAPGHKNRFEAPIASHQLMRSHGKAVQAYRALGKHQIGLVVNLAPKHAASDKPETWPRHRRADAYMNRQYLDPVFLGSTPTNDRDLRRGLAAVAGRGLQADRAADRLRRHQLLHARHDPPRRERVAVRPRSCPQSQSTYTDTGWEVHPQGLTEILCWLKQRYGNIPQYVTENGAAFYDPPKATTAASTTRCALATTAAPARDPRRDRAGRRLRGYCAWSLLDNLEWSLGFSKRFGIVHVNFDTQERTLKDSAHFYRSVIATNGARARHRLTPQRAGHGPTQETRSWPSRSRMWPGRRVSRSRRFRAR
jgi:beta-glucosidase